MSWGKDGVPKTSKHAPKFLQELVAKGHLRQPPVAAKSERTPQEEAALVPEKYNPGKVMAGQFWRDLDERNRSTVTKELRMVKIIGLAESEAGYKALVENVATHRRSFVALSKFSPSGKRGYAQVFA